MRQSIFFCAYGPFVYLLWRNIYWNLKPFAHFKNWVVFSLFACKNSVCMLDTNPLADVYKHLQILSPMLWFIFSLGDVLWNKKCPSTNFIKVDFYQFFLCAFCVMSKKPSPIPRPQRLPLKLSCQSAIVLDLTFRSMTHLESYMVWGRGLALFACGYTAGHSTICWKAYFFPIEFSWHSCQKLVDHEVVGYFWTLNFISLIYGSLLMPRPHCLDYSFENVVFSPPNLFLFLKCFGSSRSFVFPCKF